MTKPVDDPTPEPVDDPTSELVEDPIAAVEALVDEWLTVPDLGEALQLPLSAVRRLVDERDLLCLKVGKRGIRSVPARFIRDGEVLKTLKGTFTVLADGGMSDAEIVRWMFTPNDRLRVPGAPIDSLLAGSTKEVRRLAMELAF